MAQRSTVQVNTKNMCIVPLAPVSACLLTVHSQMSHSFRLKGSESRDFHDTYELVFLLNGLEGSDSMRYSNNGSRNIAYTNLDLGLRMD